MFQHFRKKVDFDFTKHELHFQTLIFALCDIFRVMALELGPYNIRVNSVGPTVVMTEMGKLGWSDPQKAQSMISKIPLGRFAGT